MIARLSRMIRREDGAAAAEMALMLPLMTVILFGGVEMGSYFWTEHQVIKSVRNGSRFAARQDFANYACDATDLGTADAAVRNMVRTGTVDGSGPPMIRTWQGGDGDGIDILVTCDTGGTYSNGGIYSDQSGTGTPNVTSAMHVQIDVRVPYPSLFESLGYLNGYDVTATAQSPVTGF